LRLGGGYLQVLLMHMPLLQSPFFWHFFVLRHGLQLPPQSTSVSLPSCMPSEHVSASAASMTDESAASATLESATLESFGWLESATLESFG
jgi:hypothetical protein